MTATLTLNNLIDNARSHIDDLRKRVHHLPLSDADEDVVRIEVAISTVESDLNTMVQVLQMARCDRQTSIGSRWSKQNADR